MSNPPNKLPSSANSSGHPSKKTLSLKEQFFASLDDQFAKFSQLIMGDLDKLKVQYHMKDKVSAGTVQ